MNNTPRDVFALLFGYKGAIPRSHYWLGLLLAVGMTAAIIIFTLIATYPLDRELQLNITAAIGAVSWTYMVMMLAVKRLGDLGVGPFWALLLLIPYARWFYLIALGCVGPKQK